MPSTAVAAPAAAGLSNLDCHPFRISESPFATSGQTDAIMLQQAIAAATQPAAQPASPPQQVGGPAKRPRSAADHPTPAVHQWVSKQRPPRPPAFMPALKDEDSLVLDGARRAAAAPGDNSPRGGKQAARSPRGSGGSAASQGSGAAGRRPAKQLSRTMGRVCVECATSSTTQWRSQGLLCNSCGVKLIKGRLPMDAESMHRRWLRLPPSIRDHPMWAAATVVAAAQGQQAAAEASGQPWCCPGCGSGERVAGPCGLHRCTSCASHQAAVAAPAAVAAAPHAPQRLVLPASGMAATVATPGCISPSPTPPTAKRRKQATPRSAHGGGGGLSSRSRSRSMSSSGSSSIQAYSFQSPREPEEGQDDASSKEASPPTRAVSRRLQQLKQQQQHERAAQHQQHWAAASATTPTGVAAVAAARAAYDTPTAAEAAAALLVLTESDEIRLAAAFELDRSRSMSVATAAAAAATSAAAAAAASYFQRPAQLEVPAAGGEPAVHATPTPAKKDAGVGGQAGGERGPTAAASASTKPAIAKALGGALQLLASGAGSSGQQGLAGTWPAPAAAADPANGIAAAAAAAGDSMQLYQQLIAACGLPEAGAAGLTADLVGRFLAAHTMPARSLAAAGGAAACGGAGAAIQAQQGQQAMLVAVMACERQFGAVVALMRSVVQLAGLTATD